LNSNINRTSNDRGCTVIEENSLSTSAGVTAIIGRYPGTGNGTFLWTCTSNRNIAEGYRNNCITKVSCSCGTRIAAALAEHWMVIFCGQVIVGGTSSLMVMSCVQVLELPVIGRYPGTVILFLGTAHTLCIVSESNS
jgi:hypothetical protein